ncbi:hypothetical protein VB773_20930 [Haloarculaceae archaeon H-GB2-1]|nr:hypothetical protein [Haloarculaceae archaeon H-GB2-1]
MTKRREFLTLLGAGTVGVAGCVGDTSSTTPTDSTVSETPTREEVTPTQEVGIENGTRTNNTSPGTPTRTETVTPGPEQTEEMDLTGDEIYYNWIHGQDDDILEQAQETINFHAVNVALKEGNTRVEKVANAIQEANSQYSGGDGYQTRHKTVMSAVHQTLQQRNDLIWNFHTMKDWAKSTAYPSDGLDYSKIWVEGADQDINAALNPDNNEPAYHIEGEEANGDVEEILKNLRDPEVFGHISAHNYDGISNEIDYFEATGEEYSDDEIEEASSFWLEKFSNYIWREGRADPSSIDDWRALHEGIESGADAIRALNEAYHNSEYGENGEIALYSTEGEELDGSVSMEEIPEDHDPSTDGIAGNPAA